MHGMGATKVVLAHGVFDVLHLGHIRHLQEARSLGDRLVVSITPDAHVNKGAGRPLFTAEQRREALLALDCVDDVVISGPTAAPAINKIAPDIYVKGIDYENSPNPDHAADVKAVEALGGRCHITQTRKWSSTQIIGHERLSDEARRYLDGVRGNGWLDQIRDAFSRVDALNLAFVGETIVDEYRYVKPIGRPAKEFILATVETKVPEAFFGGIVAAAHHADWQNVSIITSDGNPLRKTRYVDQDFSRKLFEVYSEQRITLSDDVRASFQCRLIDAVRKADAVIVMDFGHGLMGAQERHIVEGAKFLAVNAQTNAGNHGFNPVTNYRQANLVCIDEPEARLAVGRQFEESAADLAGHLSRRIITDGVIVTQGSRGATSFGTEYKSVPSFASRTVDTMGAGDAFLAVAGPLVAAGLDLEIATFCGNAAGGIKTDIVGHRRHVERGELMQAIEGLLA